MLFSNVDILEPDLEADMLTQTVPGRPKVLATTMDADLTRLAPMTNKPQSMSRPGTAQCGGDGFMIENRVRIYAQMAGQRYFLWTGLAVHGLQNGKVCACKALRHVKHCSMSVDRSRAVGLGVSAGSTKAAYQGDSGSA